MQYISNVLRSILILTLFSSIVYGVTGSKKLSASEQTLKAIQDCMSRSPIPWPDEWKQQYLETIRKAVELHRDVPHFALQLEILRKGFALYWDVFTKSTDRSLFEVHLAQIRWYIEHLMSTEFPSEDERKKLRDQYKNIWDHVANSLLKQFLFLDPNVVEEAKADDLSQCYRKIDAPLIPVYLRPFSEAQMEQIKQRWYNLRYARVDLWRRLGDSSKAPVENRDASSSSAERDYELTKKCLAQLLGQIWMVASQRPDYYVSALENRNEALQRRYQSIRQARTDKQRMEKEYSRQLFQTEHISFLLTALLETPACFDESVHIRIRESIPLEQKGGAVKGGGAYEVANFSQQK